MKPDTKLSSLAGIGPAYITRLARLGIENLTDLLYHFPFRYEDLSAVRQIAEIVEGEVVTVRGQVWEIQNIRTRHGKFLTKALVNDGSASITIVWFNQPYLTRVIKVGVTISLAGKANIYQGKLSLTAPDFEIGDLRTHTGRIIPIYPETQGLSSKWLRSKITPLAPILTTQLKEYLPPGILRRYHLLSLEEALIKIHSPGSLDDIDQARRRFGFEELFILHLAALMRKAANEARAGVKLAVSNSQVNAFIASLPFRLTSSQQRAAWEILSDLKGGRPMNRLLQGDVGSGKTVVAAIAAYVTSLNKMQTAIMAPTEILAQQHFETLTTVLAKFGVSVGLRTRSKKSGPADVTVGTQALIATSAAFDNLGLVIIDEQHRFGVAQRALLKSKGSAPHLLTMTATPIPRTLALSLYGDLDLSTLDELPPGRQIVKTYLTPPAKRDKAYDFIRSRVKLSQQVFIVTPLIEPSESLSTLRSATQEFERLKTEVFPELRLGLLHGRLTTKNKQLVLDQFRDKKLDILVTTPVVEVGIDIPNATVMVIEGSDHFGLAQLHQLRGRVGRGVEESWCLLFSDSLEEGVNKRLQAMETQHLGAKLAELDLALRGPGELYGIRQSGIPELKIAKLTDTALITETRRAAEDYLASQPRLPSGLTQRLEKLLETPTSPD